MENVLPDRPVAVDGVSPDVVGAGIDGDEQHPHGRVELSDEGFGEWHGLYLWSVGLPARSSSGSGSEDEWAVSRRRGHIPRCIRPEYNPVSSGRHVPGRLWKCCIRLVPTSPVWRSDSRSIGPSGYLRLLRRWCRPDVAEALSALKGTVDAGVDTLPGHRQSVLSHRRSSTTQPDPLGSTDRQA